MKSAILYLCMYATCLQIFISLANKRLPNIRNNFKIEMSYYEDLQGKSVSSGRGITRAERAAEFKFSMFFEIYSQY